MNELTVLPFPSLLPFLLRESWFRRGLLLRRNEDQQRHEQRHGYSGRRPYHVVRSFIIFSHFSTSDRYNTPSRSYLYLAAGAPVGLLVLFRVLRTHQLENGISHFRSDSDRTFSRNSHRFPRKPRPFSNLDVTVDISTVVELHSPAAQSRKSVVSVGEGFEMEVKSPSTPDFEREAAKSEDLYYLALGKEEGQRSTEKR